MKSVLQFHKQADFLRESSGSNIESALLKALRVLKLFDIGIERAQDYADVVKLIQANDLPRAYGVDQDVRDLYHKMWDEIHK